MNKKKAEQCVKAAAAAGILARLELRRSDYQYTVVLMNYGATGCEVTARNNIQHAVRVKAACDRGMRLKPRRHGRGRRWQNGRRRIAG